MVYMLGFDLMIENRVYNIYFYINDDLTFRSNIQCKQK